MKLKGKVALITGASKGLGRASTVEMAREALRLQGIVHHDQAR